MLETGKKKDRDEERAEEKWRRRGEIKGGRDRRGDGGNMCVKKSA